MPIMKEDVNLRVNPKKQGHYKAEVDKKPSTLDTTHSAPSCSETEKAYLSHLQSKTEKSAPAGPYKIDYNLYGSKQGI